MIVAVGDHDGQTPASPRLAGTSHNCDAPGREVQRVSRSELGNLVTSTANGCGCQKSVTSPKGLPTAYTHQALGEPSEDAVGGVSVPEGLSTGHQPQRAGSDAIRHQGRGRSPNVPGLPKLLQSGGIQRDRYAQDAHSNLAFIGDVQTLGGSAAWAATGWSGCCRPTAVEARATMGGIN